MTLPVSKNDEYGYELAYRLACEQLTRIQDIKQQCRKCGACYIDEQNAIKLEYLNQSYSISLPDVGVSLPGEEKAVPVRDRILILHYLTQAKGTPLSNKMITFKELSEGSIYFPTFNQRTIRPLAKHFGNEPHRLFDIAGTLGGYEANFGDTAVTINAFKQVPITLVLWKGNDEFGPEGNILFDSTISDYLPTEDITVLCETITWKLVKLLRTGDDHTSRS